MVVVAPKRSCRQVQSSRLQQSEGGGALFRIGRSLPKSPVFVQSLPPPNVREVVGVDGLVAPPSECTSLDCQRGESMKHSLGRLVDVAEMRNEDSRDDRVDEGWTSNSFPSAESSTNDYARMIQYVDVGTGRIAFMRDGTQEQRSQLSILDENSGCISEHGDDTVANSSPAVQSRCINGKVILQHFHQRSYCDGEDDDASMTSCVLYTDSINTDYDEKDDNDDNTFLNRAAIQNRNQCDGEEDEMFRAIMDDSDGIIRDMKFEQEKQNGEDYGLAYDELDIEVVLYTDGEKGDSVPVVSARATADNHDSGMSVFSAFTLSFEEHQTIAEDTSVIISVAPSPDHQHALNEARRKLLDRRLATLHRIKMNTVSLEQVYASLRIRKRAGRRRTATNQLNRIARALPNIVKKTVDGIHSTLNPWLAATWVAASKRLKLVVTSWPQAKSASNPALTSILRRGLEIGKQWYGDDGNNDPFVESNLALLFDDENEEKDPSLFDNENEKDPSSDGVGGGSGNCDLTSTAEGVTTNTMRLPTLIFLGPGGSWF